MLPRNRRCRIRGAHSLGQLDEALLLVLLSVHDLDHLVEQNRILNLDLPLPLLFNPVHSILALALLRASTTSLVLG